MQIRHYLRTVLALGALLASVLCGAEPFAYVSNHDGNSVMVIDLATNTVVASVPLPGTHTLPHAMALHSGTGRLYVLRESEFGDGAPGWVIDTATNSVIATLPTVGEVVVVNPTGTRLYAAPGLYVIDTATDMFDGGPISSPNTQGLAITPDGSRLYAAGLYGVRVFDTSTRAQVGMIDVHDNLVAIAINAAGTRAYAVSDSFVESPVMAVIDITTNTVVTKV